MSLIKYNKDGKIRLSWADKKTKKRLKIILEKSQRNSTKMWNTIKYFNSLGLEVPKELEDRFYSDYKKHISLIAYISNRNLHYEWLCRKEFDKLQSRATLDYIWNNGKNL